KSDGKRHGCLQNLENEASSATRRNRAPIRRRIAKIERATRKIGFLRNGKKLPGRVGRSAGNDRYLRFCSWSFAPATRVYNAQRTPGTQNVRTIPSAWSCGDYFRIQFSGCSLGLEHSVGLDLWRCLRLETFGKNTFMRNCL